MTRADRFDTAISSPETVRYPNGFVSTGFSYQTNSVHLVLLTGNLSPLRKQTYLSAARMGNRWGRDVVCRAVTSRARFAPLKLLCSAWTQIGLPNMTSRIIL